MIVQARLAVIRPVQEAELSMCAKALLDLQDTTAWRRSQGHLNQADLESWMYLALTSRDDLSLFVADEAGTIVGGCGGAMGQQMLPPHVPYVWEWIWWGRDKRILAKTWRAVVAWGREKGAWLSCRLKYTSQGPIHESARWEWL